MAQHKLFSTEVMERLLDLCTCDPPRAGALYTNYEGDHPNGDCEFVRCMDVIRALRQAIALLEEPQREKAIARVRKILELMPKEPA
jgi:hypothetical protein